MNQLKIRAKIVLVLSLIGLLTCIAFSVYVYQKGTDDTIAKAKDDVGLFGSDTAIARRFFNGATCETLFAPKVHFGNSGAATSRRKAIALGLNSVGSRQDFYARLKISLI